MRSVWTRGRRVGLAALAVAALMAGAVTPADAAAASPPIGQAPADPDAPQAPSQVQQEAAAGALADRPRHKMPNLLLKEKLAPQVHGGPKPDPAVSALCQTFIDKPNPYRKPAPNVRVIDGDATVQAGSMTGCSTAQNETTIAVNHTNPRNLVAGSNDYRDFNTRTGRNDASGWVYSTFDGGRTWRNVRLPNLVFQSGAAAPLSYMDAAGDPVVAFGPGNTVYYANLVFSRAAPPTGQQAASGLTMSVSHDGGRTWGDPSIIVLDGVRPDGTPTPAYVFHDKEWITADPHSGTVYVTWTKFTYNAQGRYVESPIVSKASRDFGRTWEPEVRVGPGLAGFPGGITPFNQGSNPQVGRDGTLYVAYQATVCATTACNGADDHDAVVVATSRDRGRTFRNEEVASTFNFPATLTGVNFRLNSFPLMSYDKAADQLWITWADDRNGIYDANGKSVKTNGDVFVVSSRPGHRGWSRPLRIGTPSDEFFPAIAARGRWVAVSYHTRGYDPDGVGVDYAYSRGFGPVFTGSPVRRITTETSDPSIQFAAPGPDGKDIQGTFVGDYTHIAIGSDLRVHPVWVDFRGGPGVTKPNQDVYTQSLPVF